MLIKPLENLGEPKSEKAPRDTRKSASSMISGNHHNPEADSSQKPAVDLEAAEGGHDQQKKGMDALTLAQVHS